MSQEITSEEQKILDFLKQNIDDYYNIKDLSNGLKISYPTALKRVEILERFGYIKIINIGNNKVCVLETKNE